MSQLRIHKLLNYRMIRRQLCKVQSHLLEMFVKRSREPLFFAKIVSSARKWGNVF